MGIPVVKWYLKEIATISRSCLAKSSRVAGFRNIDINCIKLIIIEYNIIVRRGVSEKQKPGCNMWMDLN